ncbi:hypothetical protein Landi51_01602 [Colletotrichum acutatum]
MQSAPSTLSPANPPFLQRNFGTTTTQGFHLLGAGPVIETSSLSAPPRAFEGQISTGKIIMFEPWSLGSLHPQEARRVSDGRERRPFVQIYRSVFVSNKTDPAPSSLDCMAAHAAAPRLAIPAVPSGHGYGVLLIRWFNAYLTHKKMSILFLTEQKPSTSQSDRKSGAVSERKMGESPGSPTGRRSQRGLDPFSCPPHRSSHQGDYHSPLERDRESRALARDQNTSTYPPSPPVAPSQQGPGPLYFFCPLILGPVEDARQAGALSLGSLTALSLCSGQWCPFNVVAHHFLLRSEPEPVLAVYYPG